MGRRHARARAGTLRRRFFARVCPRVRPFTRAAAQDRLIIAPDIGGARGDASMFGVFDGTVGDFAANFVHEAIVDNFCRTKVGGARPRGGGAVTAHARARRTSRTCYQLASPMWRATRRRARRSRARSRRCARAAPRPGAHPPPPADPPPPRPPAPPHRVQAFLTTDAELIRECAERKLDYASSTGVAVVITGDLLTVAHVGDSRIGESACGRRALFSHGRGPRPQPWALTWARGPSLARS